MTGEESYLEPGDTVRLLSGGPLMTIASREGKSFVCLWFTDGELRSSKFPEITLEYASEESEEEEAEDDSEEGDETDDDTEEPDE